MKKCPFLKEYQREAYNLYGQGIPIFDYREKFQECIGEKCAAYALDYSKSYWENEEEKPTPICLLINRRE